MFGINCAPEIFQKIMERVLAGCEGCLNYIDDIIVFGSTKEQHDKRVRKVQDRLTASNVTLNKQKCVIGVKEIEFLGHHLSPEGIKPKHDKITAIQQFRAPATSEETRSFLGLVNYVGKFIPHLATITEPLRRLTRQDVKFEWKQEQQNAFDTLKAHMSKENTLGYYNVRDRTQIVADASPVGLGAVLIQFKNEEPRIISYASRSLSQTEQKYAQTEKEALALVWAMEKYHYYIFGREVELVTDHKALEVIFSPKAKPCARIERWVLRLQSYRYKVVYKPGKTNIADPLSRLCVARVNNTGKNDDAYVKWITTYAEPKAIKLEQINAESAKDTTILAVKQAMENKTWSDATKFYKHIESELCFNDDILLRGTRIVIPTSLVDRALELAHEGHPGMSVMKKRLRAKVWWPKMDTDVDKYVKKCEGCTLVSAPSAPEPMSRHKLPSEPWQHIAIDFCGPLPSGHHLFVIVDYYSRFLEIEIMTKIDSTETIKRLKRIFARFGLPLSITADNGRQFVSTEFKDYCNTNNIKLISTIPWWPQMNGEVERQNRSILKRLSISQQAKRNWMEDLQEYLLMYRSTPHSVTLKSPAELMFNRCIRDKLPTFNQAIESDSELLDRDTSEKEKGKEYADKKRHAKQNDIKEGDEVIAMRTMPSNKLATRFDPTTYKVIQRSGPEVTIENPETGVQYRRNVTHTKKIHTDSLPQPADVEAATLSPPAAPNSTAQDGTSKRRADTDQQPESTRQQPKRNRTVPKRYQ